MKAARERNRNRRQVERAARAATLKDRLIQTRVPESLESALKEEARKRRLSVSHLIRNVLEDTFELVDNVVTEVDNLVQDSVGLARQVRRDAERIAQTARSSARPRAAAKTAKTSKPADDDSDHEGDGDDHDENDAGDELADALDDALDDVVAWNKVVLNRSASCAKCDAALKKGGQGHLGVSQTPGSAPVWLCAACLAKL